MGHLDRVLGQIRRMLRPVAADTATDGQLLDRFAATRDEAAFTTLVERHGPLVRGVCRRLLPDDNDIDDAFQATFLVLARKARTLRRPQSLVCWLHGVAQRIALNQRKSAARRDKHEKGAAAMARVATEDFEPEPDLRPLLDEELRALADKYRVPLLLCYLEGKTNEQAAQELGWPAGTVSGRLARARELLRTRLARRGIVLSAVALATQLAQKVAPAAVPAALVQTTVQSVLLFTANTAAIPTAVTPAVTLAEGVLRAMSMTKVKLLAALSLAVVVALGAAGILAQRLRGHNEAQASALVPTPAGPERADDAGEEIPFLQSVYSDDGFAGGRSGSGFRVEAIVRRAAHLADSAVLAEAELPAVLAGVQVPAPNLRLFDQLLSDPLFLEEKSDERKQWPAGEGQLEAITAAGHVAGI
jgi:RNA polymerase sigma factor (sigma-70 family)